MERELASVINELCRLNVLRVKPPDQDGRQGFTLVGESEWGKTAACAAKEQVSAVG